MLRQRTVGSAGEGIFIGDLEETPTATARDYKEKISESDWCRYSSFLLTIITGTE